MTLRFLTHESTLDKAIYSCNKFQSTEFLREL
jgi:hypothetical protein